MKARWLVPLLLAALVVALAGPALPGATRAAAAAATPPAAARSGPRPVLTFASRGPRVVEAQTLLNRHGYRVPVTGFYGLLTVRQVRRFQVAHGIRNTGQVGPLTWPKLLGGAGRRPAAQAPASRSAAPRPVLTFGSRGPLVAEAQRLLGRHGYRVRVTGLYWLDTVRQVRRFQVAHGIRNTGQVGPLTWPKLLGRRSGPLARATPAARAARPARTSAARAAGVVYLTFDDGPTPAWTPQVLDLLARYRARATFFVVGRSAATWPGLVRRAYASGHGVGNHTWNHRRLTGLRGAGLAAEVGATSAVIGRATGARPRCLRPPYGTVDAASAYQARALGLRLTMWDVDPYDWRRPGAGVIAGRVLSRVRSGDVVLLHDGGGDRSQTVAALRQVLASLSARGFRFRALCR
jgi:peptidoglycan/xylan/chitin deacetylase (PgdA/CDA1 family)